MLSRTKIYPKECSFWQYMIYGDIHRDCYNECIKESHPLSKAII